MASAFSLAFLSSSFFYICSWTFFLRVSATLRTEGAAFQRPPKPQPPAASCCYGWGFGASTTFGFFFFLIGSNGTSIKGTSYNYSGEVYSFVGDSAYGFDLLEINGFMVDESSSFKGNGVTTSAGFSSDTSSNYVSACFVTDSFYCKGVSKSVGFSRLTFSNYVSTCCAVDSSYCIGVSI